MIRILIADDEEYEREYLKKIIEEDYKGVLELVCAAKDGAELLTKALEYRPEIILMDIRMPRLDGLEAASQLRMKLPKTELVILSAYGQFSYAKQAMKLGVRDFLVKPYLDAELRETLNRLIAGLDPDMNAEKHEQMNEESRIMELLYEDADSDIVWNLAFQKQSGRTLEKELQLYGIRPGGYKCIVFFQERMLNIGGAGTELIRHFFARPSNKVIISSLFHHIVLYIFSGEELAYSEMNAAIRKTREYLSGLSREQVLCGVSGTCRSFEDTGKAFREAEAYIEDYALPGLRESCSAAVRDIEELCGAQERLQFAILSRNQAQTEEYRSQIVRILRSYEAENEIFARDLRRLLMSMVRRMNGQADKRIPTEAAMSLYELFSREEGRERPELAFVEAVGRVEKLAADNISPGNTRIVRKAKKYLGEHYARQLGLQTVADELKVSAGYLSKCFKAQEGKSFTEYLTELRLEKAKELMKESDMSITGISYAVGFQDPGYFGKCFKKNERISPSEYAAMLKLSESPGG